MISPAQSAHGRKLEHSIYAAVAAVAAVVMVAVVVAVVGAVSKECKW